MAKSQRHHYLPKFLLRRFAATEGKWAGHVWRLDLQSGRITPAVPRTEASRNRYYALPAGVAGGFDPERLIARVESDAAGAIARLERGAADPRQDPMWLALFALLQWARTPMGRRNRRAVDEAMALQLAEMRLSAKDKVIQFMLNEDPSLSEEDAEKRRLALLDDLRNGRVVAEATHEQEIASMFVSLPESAAEVAARCDWTYLRIPDEDQLVLPDTGLTRYDPTPHIPGRASGFLGSPSVENALHLAPGAAVLITPGASQILEADADEKDVIELNLRAYGSSDICVYARDQEILKDVRRYAKRHPRDVHARRPVPQTLWIGERDPDAPSGAPVRFIGHSSDGTRKQDLYVDKAANDGPGLRPEDLW